MRRQGWLPRSALIIQGYTPVSGPSNKSTLVVGEAFGWGLNDTSPDFFSNVGAGWRY